MSVVRTDASGLAGGTVGGADVVEAHGWEVDAAESREGGARSEMGTGR